MACGSLHFREGMPTWLAAQSAKPGGDAVEDRPLGCQAIRAGQHLGQLWVENSPIDGQWCVKGLVQLLESRSQMDSVDLGFSLALAAAELLVAIMLSRIEAALLFHDD